MTERFSRIAEVGKYMILPAAVVGIMFSFYGSAPPLRDCGDDCDASTYVAAAPEEGAVVAPVREDRLATGDSCPPGSPFCGAGGGCMSPMSTCMKMFTGMFAAANADGNGYAAGEPSGERMPVQAFGPFAIMQQWFNAWPQAQSARNVAADRYLTANQG